MSSTIELLKSLSLGQQLLIDTNSELLLGTLLDVDHRTNTIQLDDVRDIKRNFTYKCPQFLAYRHMKSIKLIKNDNPSTSTNIKSEETLSACSSSTNSHTKPVENPNKPQRSISSSSKEECSGFCVELSLLDLQLLQDQLDSIVYIRETDQKYHTAIKDIRCQDIVGLQIDPSDTSRHLKASLISFSTAKTVYIFDMINLGRIFKELRLLLESERPRKAVHYSNRILDHFKHRYDLELAGVFDTFVAYCLVTEEKNHISFEKTIENVFNISNTYFTPELDSNRPPMPFSRPLSKDYILIIAKKAALQLRLYERLLHEEMLKTFYQQCYNFSRTLCRNENGYETAQQLLPNSRSGFEHIQSQGNWKDKLQTDLQSIL